VASSQCQRAIQRSPIFGALLYRWLHSLKKNEQSGRGNTYCGGVCSGRSAKPPSQGVLSATYMHTIRPRTTKFTYEGRDFMRSATPLHLHKCVARLVSDSWVFSIWCPSAILDFEKFWYLLTWPFVVVVVSGMRQNTSKGLFFTHAWEKIRK